MVNHIYINLYQEHSRKLQADIWTPLPKLYHEHYMSFVFIFVTIIQKRMRMLHLGWWWQCLWHKLLEFSIFIWGKIITIRLTSSIWSIHYMLHLFYIYIYIYIYIYVCVSVSQCLCHSVCLCLCLCLRVCLCVSVSVSLCLFLSVSVSVCVCFCLCLFLSVSVSVCVCFCFIRKSYLQHKKSALVALS